MDIIMFSIHTCCNQIVCKMFVLYLFNHKYYYMCNILAQYVFWFVYIYDSAIQYFLSQKFVFLGWVFLIISSAWWFLILHPVIRCCLELAHSVLLLTVCSILCLQWDFVLVELYHSISHNFYSLHQSLNYTNHHQINIYGLN
jgi:hypothetical protein